MFQFLHYFNLADLYSLAIRHTVKPANTENCGILSFLRFKA